RETPIGAPHGARLGPVETAERCHQNAAPRQLGAVESAAERIEDEQLDARDDLSRNALIAEAGDKFRDAAGVRIVARGSVADPVHHAEWARSRARSPAVRTTASRSLNDAMSPIMAAALPSRAIVASPRCIALMAARWVSLGMMTTW